MNREATSAYVRCAAVTTINALVSAGFSIAALFAHGSNGETALYAASRSAALLVMVLLLLRYRSRDALAAIAITMTLVQAFDAAIGVRAGDIGKAVGPAVFAVATAASVRWMMQTDRARPAMSA